MGFRVFRVRVRALGAQGLEFLAFGEQGSKVRWVFTKVIEFFGFYSFSKGSELKA